jgi:hypothetical protein
VTEVGPQRSGPGSGARGVGIFNPDPSRFPFALPPAVTDTGQGWLDSAYGTGLATPARMRGRILHSVVCLLFAFIVVGCVPSLYETARAKGSQDLDCPTYVSVDPRQGGMCVAGCGRWIEYSCFYAAGNPVCVPQSGAKPLPDT